ncbi:MAG: DUF5011 domain-containing protein, partial [Bacillota bacterium]|nr:DUF5011 domain-containing protein [Bacillota bacterium]
VNTPFVDPGFTASDNVDGNITGSVTTAGSVDTSKLGDYTLNYEVTDAAGNSASLTRIVHVVDTIKPVITVTGNNPATVYSGSSYTDAGATATDNYDGNVTSKIVTTSNVDTNKPGTYTVTYNVTDSSGNIADTVARTVNVVQNNMTAKITMTANPNTIVGDGMSTTVLTARVTNSNDEPLENVTVNFSAIKGSFPNGTSATTDKNGNATIVYKSADISGTIVSQVMKVQAIVEDKTRGIYADGYITITFEPGSIKGVVVDNETGEPIKNAIVEVKKDDFYTKVITDDKGEYKIAVPEQNTQYEVQITKPVKIGNNTEMITFTQTAVVGKISGDTAVAYDGKNTISGLILIKSSNGDLNIFNGSNGYNFEVYDSNNSSLVSSNAFTSDSNGVFHADGLENGKTYSMALTYTFPNGEKIVVGKANLSVSQDGQLRIGTILIDPYGTITDSQTSKIISGANVTLYYANTERNIAEGNIPDTAVNLPALIGFKPADNANPQISNADGQYAFMVFPHSDYYIKAVKDGYETYISGTISVENEIVKYDFAMTPIKAAANVAKPTAIPTVTPKSNSQLPKTGSPIDNDLLILLGTLFIVTGGILVIGKSVLKRR